MKNDLMMESTAELIALSEIVPQTPSGAPVVETLSALHSVKVSLTVELGKSTVTLGELLALREFSTLKVERPANAEVDVLVDGKVIARGHLVVVDDNFGVCISEVANKAE